MREISLLIFGEGRADLMVKILVFGTGGGWQKIKQFLDYSKVKIEAFVDNDNSKYGLKLDNIEIISPSNIKKYQYEYIIISSQYCKSIKKQLMDLEISEDKIISYWEYVHKYDIMVDDYIWGNYCKDELNRNLKLAFESNVKAELIVTGISYAKMGIETSTLKCNAINFALPSQDLYYDYKIAEYVIKNSKNSIKTCIIGLAYYSFDYDLSKSSRKERCNDIYFDMLGTKHNYVDTNVSKKEYILNYTENTMSKFFSDKFIEKIINFKFKKLDFEDYWNFKLSEESIEEIENDAELRATKDSKNNYPKTVEENKLILEKYLKMLVNNNIQPIIIVFPISKNYIKYFDSSKKVKFYNIINEMHCKYKFKLLDYFDSSMFSNDDFCDPAHMNKLGAIKFTKLINTNF